MAWGIEYTIVVQGSIIGPIPPYVAQSAVTNGKRRKSNSLLIQYGDTTCRTLQVNTMQSDVCGACIPRGAVGFSQTNCDAVA